MLPRTFILRPAGILKPTARLFSTSSASPLRAAFSNVRNSYYNHQYQSNEHTYRGIGLSLGLAGAVTAFATHNNPLKNDSSYNTIQAEATNALNDVNRAFTPEKKTPRFDGAFGGKLNYTHLSIGSMFGLVIGLCVGKLSSLFVFISLGVYLSVQFLNQKGIINITTTKFIKVGNSYVDIRDMILEQPSFNIPFILSFLIGAYNA
ncbi:unnamed protein product [Ambrosiozyma monospora]|uniref:Unnamed protein product n=1 Tax=Ambrosiozyma monospora TaxID=43982 RepID=A0ACB5T2K1_AMBMO|nr:unnamed protein product [Ambrosiozyma monospora]